MIVLTGDMMDGMDGQADGYAITEPNTPMIRWICDM